MNDRAAVIDHDATVRTYLLGIIVLVASAFLANAFGFLQHREQVFDVAPNSPLALRLYTIGFWGQVIAGAWLGVALMLDLRPARRAVMYLWFASVTLLLAPMPSARDDLWLAPSLCVGLAGIVWLSRSLRDAVVSHAG